MIEFFFAPEDRVLMGRVTGVYDTDEMHRLDGAVTKFVADRGEVRGIYDFSAIEQVTVPIPVLAERARQPSIVGGLRIIVAPKVIGLHMTRMFSEQQSDAGQMAPMVVARLEEAYVLLGLAYNTDFQPIDLI